MTKTRMLLLCAGILAACVGQVAAHGMLWSPVNRGSMWRFGYGTPVNYDDNALFCGGMWVQWDENGGKCGECGDDYSLARPRPNENTGKFGSGVPVAKYRSGESTEVSVLITANHLGYFELQLCPLARADQLETQECFDKHLLAVQGSSDGRYRLPSADEGFFNFTVLFPADVTCDLCVLQWTYTAGNSWGRCANGTSAVGCGQQEHFRTCSDITIY